MFLCTHLQVGADIRTSQRDAGIVEDRRKRQIHKKTKVTELLTVPWYADLLDEDGNLSDEEAM